MKCFAFFDGEWKQVKSVYTFHDHIGFVKLHSLRVFSNNEWKVVETGSLNHDLELAL